MGSCWTISVIRGTFWRPLQMTNTINLLTNMTQPTFLIRLKSKKAKNIQEISYLQLRKMKINDIEIFILL